MPRLVSPCCPWGKLDNGISVDIVMCVEFGGVQPVGKVLLVVLRELGYSADAHIQLLYCAMKNAAWTLVIWHTSLARMERGGRRI
jgi:hypothetical protein